MVKKIKNVNIKYCPKCKTPNLDLYAASISGAYYCKKCGYIGTLVIEKPFIDDRLS